MNELEEIRKIIKNYICETEQTGNQINEIEKTRTQLAKKRNEIKSLNIDNCNTDEINFLGKQISDLGNTSQELQNKLDFKFYEIRKIVNLTIDNMITSRIRRIHKIEDGIFDKQNMFNKTNSIEIQNNILNIKNELAELARVKLDIKNKQFEKVIKNESINKEEAIVLPLVEEFQIDEIEKIEEIDITNFEPIEKIEIGEVEIEQTSEIEENKFEHIQAKDDKIEELARAIVEEIIAEQTKEINIKNIELNNYSEEKIFKERKEIENDIVLTNIIAKVEDGEIVYKAQISNGEEISVYPTLEVKNMLLNDNEYREELNETITNYAIIEHKEFDKTVIKKLDPTVCEVLEKFAKKYNYNKEYFLYNYAMKFSKSITKSDMIVPITYNLFNLKNTNLCKKEKKIISKICKNAIKNEEICVIADIKGIRKIKYLINKIFNFNNIKALSEGKNC